MVPCRTYIAVIVSAFALGGCLGEAHHSNPLDPRSAEFDSVGALEGMTTRFYPPFAPVDNAEVRLAPGMYSVRSNSDGRFRFRDIPAGEYQISAAKDGFASSSHTVQVEMGASTDTVRVRMDGLPTFRLVEVHSIHISRWFPTQDLYLLEVVAAVEDPDGLGDLNRVWFEIPDHAFTHGLEETSIAGRYSIMLPSDSLPGENLHALQGSAMVVTANDEAGFESSSAPHHIIRVIDHTPVAVEPQGQKVMETATPTFEWGDAALPFAFTYRIDVVRDQANVQTVVETIEGIPADSTSYRLETPLPSGTYFWTVSVVDAFGNRSRSKEAGFIIE